MKRSPIKHKPKRYPIPKEEIAKADERAGGCCEGCGLVVRPLQNAHIKHRGIGGVQRRNTYINDHRNIAKCCLYCHDIIDGRIKAFEGNKEHLREKLKNKLGWYDWANEHRIREV